MVKCFLVEPVYDVPESLPKYEGYEKDRDWDPERRAILGWVNPETGERKDHPHQFGPGAMWFAVWQNKNWDWNNETEPHLLVETPSGCWDIDSRCGNCTMPDDKTHRCWIRHGTPPNITVDKNGLTCQAGAGSIQTKGYHGFLQNGYFT